MKHSNHKLTYIEMYPEPLNIDEPSGAKIIGGAFVAAVALYCVTVFLFSL